MTDALAYHEYYSHWYRNDSDTMERVGAFYRELIAPVLPTERTAHILDVGAGIGMLLRTLRSMGYQNIQGVEVNAHQKAGAGNLKDCIDVTDDTARWLNARTAQFDIIFCLDVLEHVPKSEHGRLMQAMAQALCPGGRLVCTVPNANSAIASRWRYNDYTHELAFTEHSLSYVLRAAGLDEIRVASSPVFQFSSGTYPQLKKVLANGARTVSRLRLRCDLVGELGFDEGMNVPLGVNLLGTGIRP